MIAGKGILEDMFLYNQHTDEDHDSPKPVSLCSPLRPLSAANVPDGPRSSHILSQRHYRCSAT